MTSNFKNDQKKTDEKCKDRIRNIATLPELVDTILEIAQTQDVFHIGFYPENNHLDIDVHGFLDPKDIYYEVKDRLRELKFSPLIIYHILRNIAQEEDKISQNIKYFGVAHIFD